MPDNETAANNAAHIEENFISSPAVFIYAKCRPEFTCTKETMRFFYKIADSFFKKNLFILFPDRSPGSSAGTTVVDSLCFVSRI